MKKAIICGVCAVALLLLITPTIPAQQYTLVKETIEEDFQQHLTDAITALKSIEKDQTRFEDQEEIIMKSFNEMKQTMELGGLDAIPTCFKFLISTLISLILAALGTLFGMIFGPLLAFIVKVITAPAVILAKILAFLFDGNNTITE
jgi:hypothetical protein